MHRRRTAIAGAAFVLIATFVFIAAVLAAGCVPAVRPPAGGVPEGTPGPGGTAAGPVIGQKAPQGMLLPVAGGEAISFPGSFKGRAVMMSFFSPG